MLGIKKKFRMKKIKLKDISLSSRQLILCLSLYLSYVLNIEFLKIFISKFQILNFYHLMSFIGMFLVVSFPIMLVLNIILFKYTIKVFSCLILIISAVTNYIMVSTGVLIDSDMIRNVFETNTREAFDLVTLGGVFCVFLTGIIPALFVSKINIRFDRFKVELIKRVISCSLIVVLSLLYIVVFAKNNIPFIRNNTSLKTSYNTLNYLVGTSNYLKSTLKSDNIFKILDDSVVKNTPTPLNNHVIVLVVGETARSKNFSLGSYPRETNPLLKKQANLIYVSDVTSCGTSTSISVPCMFSSKGRDQFDVDEAKQEENALDLIKKAGWDIVWFENDNGCKKVCQRLTHLDVYDENNSKFCQDNYCYDEVFLQHLDEKLKSIKPNQDSLIVLHTIGSHGPSYYKRYPKEFERFVPACNTSEVQNCSNEELVNTYDNTILYTDYVLSTLIDQLKEYKNFETSLIYISDHGESLGEKGLYLHGMPYAIAPEEQKHVPLIMWFSDKMLKDSYIDFKCLSELKSKDLDLSHDNMFHTLLGLSSTSSVLYNSNLDILFPCRKKTNK